MKKIYEYLENKGLIKSIFSGGSFTVTNLGIRYIEFSDPKPLINSKVDELIAAIDQLNTISRNKLGCKIFLGNSKTLLDLRKQPTEEGDFVLAIARIANIIEEAYLDEIKGKLTTKPKPGSINYIEDLLKSRNLNYDNNALKILRKLYKLRSTKAPIHSGEHEAVDILNEFGIDYPVITSWQLEFLLTISCLLLEVFL
jgi:hypothetical protein